MRRFFISLVIVVLAVSLSFPVSAKNDSFNLDSDEMELLNAYSNDVVVKLYGLYFMDDFALQHDIKDITEHAESAVYMIVPKNEEIFYMNSRNGALTKINSQSRPSDWSEFYKYAVSPYKVFDPTVKVEQVYCLDGDASHDGVYIYYITDRGDYVLYKEYLNSTESYLFPINAFHIFAETVYSYRILHKDLDGGCLPIDELFELDSYRDLLELDSYRFTPKKDYNWIAVVGIAGIVLVVVGSTVFWAYRAKIQRKNEDGI